MTRSTDAASARSPTAGPFLGGLPLRRLPEALSERERHVQRLLPTLLSYTDIAGEPFVGVDTVTTPIESSHRKLDVGRRRDAVVRPRALRLI